LKVGLHFLAVIAGLPLVIMPHDVITKLALLDFHQNPADAMPDAKAIATRTIAAAFIECPSPSARS
jgi:hypothetical protein